ncbi:hypothetical protein IHE44_0010637 [Lamprotornis superbus]|uniref:RING-type domain-containing protein n=1 Tax=Lamprotornis superbus TaxID=245042 RepID=A0A835NJ74_9PASS|nr:hypothetical protein IHE44_0010637 [Lamprotornis superbus]
MVPALILIVSLVLILVLILALVLVLVLALILALVLILSWSHLVSALVCHRQVTLPLSPQTSMKNMERELVCPVCKEMYKQPLALPCAHNVCHVCASEVLLQHGHLYCDPTSEPTSPAATPSTRSPRLGRRAVPKPDRLDRLLKSGGAGGAGRRDRGTKGTGMAGDDRGG